MLLTLTSAISSPKAVSEAHATQLGGVLGEEAAVSGALGRVASEAIEAAISEALAEASPAKSPRQTGAWSTARTKAGVPTAMILKRARRKKGSSAKRSAPETKATTPANPEPPKAPTKPGKAPTKIETTRPRGSVGVARRFSMSLI